MSWEPTLPAAPADPHTRLPTDDPRPIRVLHIIGRFEIGGTQTRLVELLRTVDRRRYQVDFCATSGSRSRLDSEVEALGGKIHYSRLGLQFPLRFLNLVRRGEYDVVHSHILVVSGLILLLAFFAGAPVRVAHFHSALTYSSVPRRLRNSFLRLLINIFATDILAVSAESMAVEWRKNWHDDKRCVVTYNGLSLDAYKLPADRAGVRKEFRTPAESKLCIMVGRLVPEKNHAKLLAVFAAMAARNDKIQLLIVGQGPLEAALRQQIAVLGLEDKVIMTGSRHDVPRLLLASDLMIFPSLSEGLAGVILEGVAAGIPVLAGDLPAVREIRQWFGTIHSLPLTAADDAWAEKALALLDRPHARVPLSAWEETPFAMRNAVRQNCAIWENSIRV